MLALTVMLITVGAVLAALGSIGFVHNATTTPDVHDLAYNRAMARTGRYSTWSGLGMLCTSTAHPGGIVLLAVVVAAGLSIASLITNAPLHRIPKGAPAG